MRILVCVKPVPRGDGLLSCPERAFMRRETAALSFNPPDCAALELALRLKERHGACVTVVSLGPARAETLLREVCALPVNETVLVTDPRYAGSDSLATSRILARSAAYLGGFDLILLGRRAIDGETGHVGPELAALLGIASCVTNITGGCFLEDGTIRCARLLEDSLQTVLAPLPAVLTVCGGEYALRPPSVMGMRNAKPVILLTDAELRMNPGEVGLEGSPTVVVKTRPAREGYRTVRLIHDAEAGAAAIVDAVRTRPQRRTEPQHPKSGPSPHGAVWVVSLAEDAATARAAGELAGAARRMGAEPVMLALKGRDDAACAWALATYAAQQKPSVLLMPATIRGRCVAPYCAALLQTGLTADCTDLYFDGEGSLVQTRPAYGGGLVAEICCRTRPQMATVRPGVFAPFMHVAGSAPLPAPLALEAENRAGGVTVRESCPLGTEALHEARIVVAGGKGIGGKEGFSYLERLAALLGAGVGASRSAVDAGYAPYARQVGQTGATVRPDVYIAFAVSGTVQHVAGMRESGIVVAVNTDAAAPIFNHANIGIVAPWRDVANALARMLGAGCSR